MSERIEVKTISRKCSFFLRYLGHLLSQKEIKTDPEENEADKMWTNPKNLKGFIELYSKIGKPLNDLSATCS